MPRKRDDEKMFSAMGREIGNIHRRAPKAEAATVFLKALQPKRLVSAAHDMLAAMGAEAFAERARDELLAAGETVRQPTA